MKFLIDAQLPQKLATALVSSGHETIHTLNLPDKNCGTDGYIRRLSAMNDAQRGFSFRYFQKRAGLKTGD